jgi:hypothetical protein
VRGEDHVGPVGVDRCHHQFDRCGSERSLRAIALALRLHHDFFRRDRAGLEDLRPAKREEPVTDHQHLLAGGELPGDRFHRVGSAAGDHDCPVRPVNLTQRGVNLAHDLLESLAHVVERAVGEDDRVFEQAIGIDVGAQGWHVGISCLRAPIHPICPTVKSRDNCAVVRPAPPG